MHAPRTRRRRARRPGGRRPTVVPALALTTSVAAGAEPGPRTYVVRTGDTLSEIAAQQGTTTARLAAANGIEDPNDIRTGRRLVIPAPRPRRPPLGRSTSCSPARASGPSPTSTACRSRRWPAPVGAPPPPCSTPATG